MLLRILLFFILLSVVAPLHAKLVEVDGAAVIKNDAMGKARELAIQQAIRQAQLQTLAMVDSASIVSGNRVMVDSAKVSAAGMVKDVVVIKEWQRDDVYFVRIRAQVVEEKLRLPSNAARYRKKISVTQFDVADRHQISDMPGIEQELARELQRRLENTGLVLAKDGADYRLPETQQYTLNGEPVSYHHAVNRLAEQLGSQFVVSGSIVDMGVSSRWLRTTRHIVLDLAVFDALSGALVSRHRINERVAGAGYMPADMRFGSVDFLVSEYGSTLDRVLDQLAIRIIDDLSILPFAAKVLHVDGTTVTFNAGATSLVGVGDKLMAYQLAEHPVFDQPGKRFLGIKESPSASLVVKVVQPQFAVAELESAEVTMHPGDVVRFGWQ